MFEDLGYDPVAAALDAWSPEEPPPANGPLPEPPEWLLSLPDDDAYWLQQAEEAEAAYAALSPQSRFELELLVEKKRAGPRVKPGVTGKCG